MPATAGDGGTDVNVIAACALAEKTSQTPTIVATASARNRALHPMAQAYHRANRRVAEHPSPSYPRVRSLSYGAAARSSPHAPFPGGYFSATGTPTDSRFGYELVRLVVVTFSVNVDSLSRRTGEDGQVCAAHPP